MCTSCKAGFYVERWAAAATKTFGAGDMVTYGTCLAKTVGTFTRDVWVKDDRLT
jgi:hypothetical protein